MRIGLLLPSVLASGQSLAHRIFAPIFPAVQLADGLVDNGHEVFFYSTADVPTKALVIGGNDAYLSKRLSYYQMRDRDPLAKEYTETEIRKRDFENDLTMRAYQDGISGKLDIIHSYHDFVAHYFQEVTKFPTLYTLHNPLPQTMDTIEYERFNQFKHHDYISISDSQRISSIDLHFLKTIYHGTDLLDHGFFEAGGEPIVFMGRLIPDKGAAITAQIARVLDKQLLIATSQDSANRNQAYFTNHIKPLLDEKRQILDGMLSGKDKATFWGGGKLFLFPLQWEEPFGLVITDAMSAGTPVVAYARGSAPELIVDGVTGFLVNESDEKKRGEFIIKKTGIEGLKEAVQRVYALTSPEYRAMRKACRDRVEKEFSIKKMVQEYETVYEHIVASAKTKKDIVG